MGYDAALAGASKGIVDASIKVVAGLPGVEAIDNEVLWSIQAEVVWTLLGAVFRGVFVAPDGGSDARDQVQDALLPVVINDMLEAGFDWPPDSDELRTAQFRSLVEWFDEAETDNGATMRFMSAETDFFQMMLSGDIPDDSLVAKLCSRIARATGEAGNSDLIQALFLGAAEAHLTLHLTELTAALVAVQKAG